MPVCTGTPQGYRNTRTEIFTAAVESGATMTLLLRPVDDGSPGTAGADPDRLEESWRSFTLEDLLGVAGFLAGNVLAHRADPDACAQELLAWADGDTAALELAARAVAHDEDRREAHRLLTRAAALATSASARVTALA